MSKSTDVLRKVLDHQTGLGHWLTCWASSRSWNTWSWKRALEKACCHSRSTFSTAADILERLWRVYLFIAVWHVWFSVLLALWELLSCGTCCGSGACRRQCEWRGQCPPLLGSMDPSQGSATSPPHSHSASAARLDPAPCSRKQCNVIKHYRFEELGERFYLAGGLTIKGNRITHTVNPKLH